MRAEYATLADDEVRWLALAREWERLASVAEEKERKKATGVDAVYYCDFRTGATIGDPRVQRPPWRKAAYASVRFSSRIAARDRRGRGAIRSPDIPARQRRLLLAT